MHALRGLRRRVVHPVWPADLQIATLLGLMALDKLRYLRVLGLALQSSVSDNETCMIAGYQQANIFLFASCKIVTRADLLRIWKVAIGGSRSQGLSQHTLWIIQLWGQCPKEALGLAVGHKAISLIQASEAVPVGHELRGLGPGIEGAGRLRLAGLVAHRLGILDIRAGVRPGKKAAKAKVLVWKLNMRKIQAHYLPSKKD